MALTLGTPAANYTTTTSQGSGANWNGNIWTSGAAPTAGNTYELISNGTVWGNNTGNTRVRNPAAAGVQTFPGDSLTLNANTDIRMKTAGAILDFPGVGGNPGLILNGGILNPGDDAAFHFTGRIAVTAPSIFAPADNGGGALKPLRAVVIDGILSGNGSIRIVQGDPNGLAQEVTSANNPFTGGWIVNAGYLKGSGVNSLGSGTITISPTNNAIVGAKFEINYDINIGGSLVLSNGGQMVLHQVCTFGDIIIEGTHLTPGHVYTFAELNATYPANFPGSGSGSITIPVPTPPSTPEHIVVINGDSQVSLSWSPATNAVSYFVKRSEVSGIGYAVVGTPTGTSFVDNNGVFNGVTYYYVISATNALGESGNSVEVVGKPNIPVTGLTAANGTGQVALAWNSLPGASSYRVQRSGVAGGPYTAVATGVTGTTYTDTTVQPGRTYFYTVVGIFAGGAESGVSNEATGSTAPSAPTILGSALYAAKVITLAWSTNSPATSISIERSTDGVSFSPITSVGGGITAYTNSTPALSLGTTYSYRLQAQSAGGFSSYSLIVTNRTPAFGVDIDFVNNTTNSSQNKTLYPSPPGYLFDTSIDYIDQGNGYTYGWTTAGGTNISYDSRYRQDPTSPDSRYDNFAQSMKSGLPENAVWKIALPNGFYWVHFVSGDPQNVDGNFQFNVNGVVTEAYTPAASPILAHWHDFTVTTVVSDGTLSIGPGPSAVNNKIDFVNIYNAVAIPLVITQDPAANTSLVENRPLSLSVAVAPIRPVSAAYEGYTPISYKWYNGTTEVTGQTNATLNIALAQTSDAGDYVAVVTNPAGSVTSHVAHVTVAVDNDPPFAISAGSVDGTAVGICFNELLDFTDPNSVDAFNYFVDDGNGVVNPFTAGGVIVHDGKSVQLILDLSGRGGIPLSGTFTVSIGQVTDKKGNIASGISVTGVVAGLTMTNIGWDPAAPPPVAGSVFTCTNGEYDVTAGGADIWGVGDQGQLTMKPVSGDFDASVKISGITMADAISKGGLMVRQSYLSNDVTLYISMNPPPPGRDQGEAGVRTNATTGGTVAWTTASTNYLHVDGVPNAWQRLTRNGNVFKAYHSSNGVDWVIFAQTTQAMTDPVLVGLGTTGHNTTNGMTTAQYRNFKVVSTVVPPPTITPASVSKSGNTFTATFSTQSGVTYTVEYKDNLNDVTWHFLQTITGDGTVKTITDTGASVPGRFYHIKVGP